MNEKVTKAATIVMLLALLAIGAFAVVGAEPPEEPASEPASTVSLEPESVAASEASSEQEEDPSSEESGEESSSKASSKKASSSASSKKASSRSTSSKRTSSSNDDDDDDSDWQNNSTVGGGTVSQAASSKPTTKKNIDSPTNALMKFAWIPILLICVSLFVLIAENYRAHKKRKQVHAAATRRQSAVRRRTARSTVRRL